MGGDRHRRATPASVYAEREDTLLLVPFARDAGAVTFLDIGTGNGRLALEAARSGARTIATDINPDALRQLRTLARAEGLAVGVVRTDLARGLGRFDRIVSNPPYLPTTVAGRDPDRWRNLALDGGEDGCRMTARLVRCLPDHLAPRGRAHLLVSSVQDPRVLERIRAEWIRGGGTQSVVAERGLEGERLSVWELGRDADRRGR